MRHSISLALSTSVVLGALAVPGTAFAADGQATIGSVAHHQQKLGHLFIDDLRTDSDVTAIRAVIHRTGEDVAIDTVHDFQVAEGDRKTGDWITTSDVGLEITGKFAVDLVITETDGDETTLKDAGTYDYTAQPLFESFGPDNANPTADDPVVEVSGRLVEWQPITHERKPLVDRKVLFVSSEEDFVPGYIDTDHEGRFTHWVGADSYKPIEVFARYGAAHSGTKTITARKLPARITLDKTQHGGAFGAPVTISGKVDFDDAGVWKTADLVRLQITDERGENLRLGLTDRDGRFSIDTTVPAVGSSLRVEATHQGWFSNKPVVPVAFDSIATSAVTGYNASLNGNSELLVYGSVDVEGAPLPVHTVEIQESRTGTDGWSRLKTIPIDKDGWFYETIPAKPTGYYRAAYAGSATVASSMSPVLYAGRAETRIKDYKAAPATVAKGGWVTISGTLLHRTPSWQAYADKPVLIYFRPHGTTQSQLVTEVKSAANGTFTKNVKERGDGTFFALHQFPNDKHLASPSVEASVDVR
ncbi:hypothetical protein [Streptomyces sp. SP18CS02]|uniref:hypothetical protein n=1 Tax=Streptomyces sp. SP18CS02 TaxID=3002531 RepID=UPI002E793588|nr:hypothetical protein [Streptomyces sp. SP18CS02]MEE1751366.1 hypothetical protein [Streptomyces sp. SP18CS02]